MRDFITGLAEKAGQIQLDMIQAAHSSYKAPKDVVTDADIKVEKFIKEEIRRRFPDHSLFTEESVKENRMGRRTWIIDPIDGTCNYSHKLPFFCVSIAFAEDSQVLHGCIFAPARKEMFAERGKGASLGGQRISVATTADRKDSLVFYSSGLLEYDERKVRTEASLASGFQRVRNMGAMALELAYVAAGRGDAVIRYADSSKLWDYAAGLLILQEAGGKATDFKGKLVGLEERSDIVATNRLIHDSSIEMISKVI